MKLENILEQVRKPARYTGNEWNITKKDFSSVDVRVALCFPDAYEIGMSHLGFRIIYGILNSRQDTLCERVFSPWPDLSGLLRKEGVPLFSLESKAPVAEFDIVAFTLSYEMNYTNVLQILELSGIPLNAADRAGNYPLVIGGGPCTLNPEPVADFFDLFVIGDGEDVVHEVIDSFRRVKSSRAASRTQLLSELAKIEGVYVPSFYDVDYYEDGRIKRFTCKKEGSPATIKKRVVSDLDNSFYPTKYIVPYTSIIHDRVVIEIMRGCAHRCRFCQAGICYLPVRIRNRETIFRLIGESYKNTGYEEFSLMSLSSGSYPGIVPLADELARMNTLKDNGIGLSFSSLRIEDVLSRLPESIKKLKKTGLTLAPEAGTERLRRVISKEIDIGKLLEAVGAAKKEGWRRIKLYFMIGLPTEGYVDIDGILEILHKIYDSVKRGPFDIVASISPFIPKPHTPFQWEEMEPTDGLSQKMEYMKRRVRSRRIRFKFHKLNLSFLEAVFSRGDRRLGPVLLAAFKNGAQFDSWDEFFDFNRWMEAFANESIDPHFYTAGREFDAILPWDHIDGGISKEWCIKEAKAAKG